MSTQALLDKIIAERDEQVALIQVDSAKKVATIQAATATEVAAIKAAAEIAIEKEVEQIKRAGLAKARQEGKLVIQTARREAFDAVLAAAEKTVVSADPESAQAFADCKPDLEVELAKQLS